MDIEIREILASDIDDICYLINNELGYTDVKVKELSLRIEKMKGDGSYFIFVAVTDGRVVGYIGARTMIGFEMDGTGAAIIALAVAKEYQNKGIGSALVKHTETFLKEKIPDLIVFVVNSGLHRSGAHLFYEHNGYVKKTFGFEKRI
jgi:predicted N-acetyltransferase YhbS